MAQQIEAKDIKLFESEKMNDANDGGGRVTANEVESGQVNNVFQDISRVDHANGAVELRKLFMGIKTPNNAPLLGAHMLVLEPPKDPNVGAILFQPPKYKRETDRRTDAKDYIESYFVKAEQDFMQPYALNLADSSFISFFAPQQVQVTVKAGDTLALHDANNGLDEYIKVASVSITRQTLVYVDSRGDYQSFTGQVVRCQLAAPLRNTWDGGQARPNGVQNSNLRTYKTAISSAARYRGVTKTTATFEADETVLQVENILQPLVPVALQEKALVNQSPYKLIDLVARATKENETPLLLNADISEAESVLYLPTAATRGSVVIETTGSGATSWSENGSGEFKIDSGTLVGAVATIDYADGIVSLNGFNGKNVNVKYLPAVAMSVPSITSAIDITQATLGLTYTIDLSNLKPEPYTIEIEYMSAGDWLAMRDDGNGAIVGQGTGEVDYATGQILINLEHEPEIGSMILTHYVPRKENIVDVKVDAVPAGLDANRIQHVLNFGEAIEPKSITIKPVDFHEDFRTSTDSADYGVIDGDLLKGYVDYERGEIRIYTDSGELEDEYRVEATAVNRNSSGIKSVNAKHVVFTENGDISGTAEEAIYAGSLRVIAHYTSNTYDTWLKGLKAERSSNKRYVQRVLRDNGNGDLHFTDTGFLGGSIDYETGDFSLNAVFTSQSGVDITSQSNGSVNISSRETTVTDVNVTISYYEEGLDTFTAKSKYIKPASAEIILPKTEIKADETIAPKTLWFMVDGNNFFDDGNGKIINSYSMRTGAGVEVGTIDYKNGLILMSSGDAVGKEIDLKSLASPYKYISSSQLKFAIKDIPVRHASYQMNYDSMDGTTRRLVSNEQGEIRYNATPVGTIDYKTGIVEMDTRRLSGYNEKTGAVLGSLRYNAIQSQSMPLDPDIIGLDTGRLPLDGRVPIFKLGDTVVLNHSAEQAISEPTASATITIDRDHLAEAVVLCNGVELAREQYEIDLEEGKITFSSELELKDEEGNDLSGDWVIKHRIEHMTLATRVQMNGQITLQVPSAHDFPEGTAVSSALLFGDLQADVLNMFTQKTWQNNAPNWTDAPDSSGETTAKYDTINYPIQLSNESAITDKWALVFTSSNTVNVVSEGLGVIESGKSIGNTISPINPVTGQPYFVIDPQGWGGGWATNNVVRFNTESALAPFWIARTVTPAQGITQSDSFTLSPRGDSQ